MKPVVNKGFVKQRTKEEHILRTYLRTTTSAVSIIGHGQGTSKKIVVVV